MPRQSSAVLKGGSSKAVKAAEKVKALKAEIKAAQKEVEKAVKALDRADRVVEKLNLKLAKLETPSEDAGGGVVAPEEQSAVVE